MQPHRQQPTSLHRPWDSPGKNTGVGCHFLLQCMKVKSESEVAQSYPTLCDPRDCSLPGSSVHGIFQARVLEGGAIGYAPYFPLPITVNTGLFNFCIIDILGWIILCFGCHLASLVAQTVKVSAYNAGDPGSFPGSGRPPGAGNGNALQYSCLENPMDGGAWWAAVDGVPKSRTRLSNFTFTFHFHALEKEMATHSSVLAWRIPGTGEPGGLPSMWSHRVGHD